jgi:hypothetical protein
LAIGHGFDDATIPHLFGGNNKGFDVSVKLFCGMAVNA